MIVGGHACFLELASLLVTELAEGDADLHAELAHLADGLEHRLETAVAGFHTLPRRAHAEAGGAALAGLLGKRKDLVASHELSGLHAGVIAGALGAVGAVLAASARLHAQQGAELDIILVPILQMDRAGALDQVEKRAAVDLFKLGHGDGVCGAHGNED